MSTWLFILCQFSIIACAVVGGVFLTFSDFLMRSLDAADRAAGIEAMQAINSEVFRYVFMTLFLGMAALSPLIIGYAFFDMSGPTSALIIAGGTIYLVGVFAVTVFFNVPMNNTLEGLNHTAADAAIYWESVYFPKWTFWNHVRTFASVASAASYLIAVTWLVQAA